MLYAFFIIQYALLIVSGENLKVLYKVIWNKFHWKSKCLPAKFNAYKRKHKDIYVCVLGQQKKGAIELFQNDQHIDGNHIVIKHIDCDCIKRHTPYRKSTPLNKYSIWFVSVATSYIKNS